MGDDASEKTDYFEPYSHFARTLRIWFIAYGVGAPIAIFSNDTILQKLMAARVVQPAIWYFFAGIAIQIVMAMMWRTSMWYQYLAEDNADVKKTRRYRWSLWASEQYWLEVIPDLLTLGAFAWATVLAVKAACA